MFWNPDPVAFTIPFVEIPIYIYGVCFVLGFFLGYKLLIVLMQRQPLFLPKNQTEVLVDQATWFIVAGTVIGARLGHVFFYDWERYLAHPWLILNTREGGLASHGGALGVLLALSLFYLWIYREKKLGNFLTLLDLIVIPTAFVAACIRVGNFFNQEIIGTPTDLPWGIVFGAFPDHLPRHPAQLYEAVAYLITFAILVSLRRWSSFPKISGRLTGIFFLLIFGSRFFIEFVKEEQVSIFDQNFLQAGQWLSLPFIAAGLVLWVYKSNPARITQDK